MIIDKLEKRLKHFKFNNKITLTRKEVQDCILAYRAMEKRYKNRGGRR